MQQLPADGTGPRLSNDTKALCSWLTPEVFKWCEFAVASGYFQAAGVANIAQAIMKVSFGQSLGLSPEQSLNELYIVSGKVQMEPNAIFTHLANHPVYGIDVVSSDLNQATVQIYKHGKPYKDPVQFTYEQAVAGKFHEGRYGLKQAWIVDRQLQLVYKAAARAQRLWARDLFKMAVYATDEPIGDVIDATINDGSVATTRRTRTKNVASDAGTVGLTPASEQQEEVVDAVDALPGETAQAESAESPAEADPPSTAEAEPFNPDAIVTAVEINAGISRVKHNGWNSRNLTPLAQHLFQKGLPGLTIAQFETVLEHAEANKPKQQGATDGSQS